MLLKNRLFAFGVFINILECILHEIHSSHVTLAAKGFSKTAVLCLLQRKSPYWLFVLKRLSQRLIYKTLHCLILIQLQSECW